MIPRLKPDLRMADLAALWPSGTRADNVARFEQAFAELAGQRHAIAFPYGRTAQIAVLRALDRPGKQVICPSYTCVVVAHAIVKAGMEPIFVDSDPVDFNMDWQFVEQATGPETAAVIATSIFGHPVTGPGFQTYRAAHPDVTVLQDCAHSFFAGDAHREGLAAFYGLNISKLITSVFGGMVTTDDDAFATRVRQARDAMTNPEGAGREIRRALYLIASMVALSRTAYGLVNRLERLSLLDRFVKYYDPSIVDLPEDAFSAMGSIEARIGIRQCARYDGVVQHRRALAELYHERLDGVGDLVLPPRDPGMTVSHYVVRTGQAERIKRQCLAGGVQLGELIDYDIADMPSYADARYHGEKRSRAFPEQVINLPVHRGVSERDAESIATLVRAAATQTQE